MLELVDLCKSFGLTTAVSHFNLRIESGQFTVLLGPSGCGKTTVLRLVAGLETPSSGTIIVDQKHWTHVPPQKRNVAMVFQHYALYPQRTVRGNIEYPLRLSGMSKKERSQKIENISSLLGILHLLDRKPRELSGGEAQRVALARALVREPSCFLMDEPLSNLDAILRVRARAEIKRLQRDLKVTTLFVTHDQEEAVALADQIAIMDKGQLIQVGTGEELFRRPTNSFVAGFLGKPPMNLVRANIVGADNDKTIIGLETLNGGNLNLPTFIRAAPFKQHKLMVGFRPDQMSLYDEAGIANPKASWIIPGKVILVEGLEPEYVAHCDTPVGTLLVRSRRKPVEGRVQLVLPLEQAHYFDFETGERIE